MITNCPSQLALQSTSSLWAQQIGRIRNQCLRLVFAAIATKSASWFAIRQTNSAVVAKAISRTVATKTAFIGVVDTTSTFIGETTFVEETASFEETVSIVEGIVSFVVVASSAFTNTKLISSTNSAKGISSE